MNVLVITNQRVYFRFKVTGKTKCGQTQNSKKFLLKRKMSLKKIPRYSIFHICNVNKKNKSIRILEIFYMERKCLLKEVTQFTCDKKTQIFHIRKNPKPKRTLVSWRNLRYLQVKNFFTFDMEQRGHALIS